MSHLKLSAALFVLLVSLTSCAPIIHKPQPQNPLGYWWYGNSIFNLEESIRYYDYLDTRNYEGINIHVGWLNWLGRGKPKDIQFARNRLAQFVATSPSVSYFIATMDDIGWESDYKTYLDRVRVDADAGNPIAQRTIGWNLMFGWEDMNIAKNEAKGKYYIVSAAKNEDANAQAYLAYYFANRKNPEFNIPEAAYWFTESMKNSRSRANCELIRSVRDDTMDSFSIEEINAFPVEAWSRVLDVNTDYCSSKKM